MLQVNYDSHKLCCILLVICVNISPFLQGMLVVQNYLIISRACFVLYPWWFQIPL